MFFSDLWPKTSQYRGFPNQGIFGCHVTIESWKVAPFGFMLSRLYVEMRFRERARRTFFQCLLSWLGPHGRHIGLGLRKLLQLSWLDVGAQVLWRPFATSFYVFDSRIFEQFGACRVHSLNYFDVIIDLEVSLKFCVFFWFSFHSDIFNDVRALFLRSLARCSRHFRQRDYLSPFY